MWLFYCPGELMKVPEFLESKLLKKVALVSVIGFSAVAMASATVAWFAANRTLGSGGMNAKTFYYDIECSFKMYRYDYNTNIGTDIDHMDGDTPVYFNIEDGTFKFLPYDTIFVSRNKYTPAILQIAIKGPNISHISGTIKVDIEHDSSKDGSDPSKLSEYYTSAAGFMLASGMTHNINPLSETATMFEQAVTYFKSNNKPQEERFVTKTGEGSSATYSKVQTVSLEASFVNNDWVGGETLYMYLFMDYVPELADTFAATKISGEGLSGNEIDLFNDLTGIKVSYKNS